MQTETIKKIASEIVYDVLWCNLTSWMELHVARYTGAGAKLTDLFRDTSYRVLETIVTHIKERYTKSHCSTVCVNRISY